MNMIFLQNAFTTRFSQVEQAYQRSIDRLLDFVPQLIVAFLILAVTAIIARIVKRAVRTAMEKTNAETNIRFLVARGCSVFVWFAGFAVTLSFLNVNLAALFAAFGVTGAALGFAVHDIIANFISGIILLSIRPFKIGDTIAIDAYEGVVEHIEIRVTILKTADGKQVSIPNSKVFSSIIVNSTTVYQRRILFSVGIAPDAPFEQVREILLQAVKSIEGVSTAPAPDAAISGFSAIAANVDVQFWTETGANSGAIAAIAKLKVKEALQREHIAFAPPAGMVLVRSSGVRRTANGE